MKNYGIDAVPFAHDDLNAWRENFVGVQYHHTPTNLLLTGAVDDVWLNKSGEIIVVDYKSTAKEGEVGLDADWQICYKRQMEFYQWLLRKNGFTVSGTGYFVYCNGNTDKEAFDAKLEFDIKIIPYKGDDSWVEGTLFQIRDCLSADEVPPSNPTCDYCLYRESVNGVLAE